MMSPSISSMLSRHCMRKPATLRNLGGARFLSKTPLCHIVGAEHCGSSSKDGDIGKLVISNFSATPCGTKFYRKGRGPGTKYFRANKGADFSIAPGCGEEVLEKTVPMDLMEENGTIGASHGWVATLKDGVIRLQDDLNPSASDSDPKRISLPPLVTLPHCQTQLVTNVSMSSSSPEDDENCIVAVKFVGPQLSLCRPAWKENSEWVNIRIDDPGFFSSRVMYSKKKEMFSMLASEGTHMGSWDLGKNHKSHNLRFISDLQGDWEFLNTCCRQEFLVESPTGETFMVKWYTSSCYWNTDLTRPVHCLVFKIIENEFAICTKDIGDLCIFLSSKGEPFCLKASLHGLSPNFIYYLGSNFLATLNLQNDEKNSCGGSHFRNPAPYFIPPQS